MKKAMFFLGKGGVGKSTLSTATALALSANQRILHISLDPAHNLGDIYGVPLKNRATSLRPGLDGWEVDLALWVDRYLAESRDELRDQYRYNTSINLDSLFDILRYSPGTEEYAVLKAIETLYGENEARYDRIIFDTPPTALSLRFLALPSLSMRWVKELAGMRETILSRRQTILHLNPESQAVRGATKKEDDPVFDKLTGIQARLGKMFRLFSTGSFMIVIINDDKLSVAESRRISQELAKLEIPVHAVCMNKIACTDPEDRTAVAREIFPGVPLFTTELVPEGISGPEDLNLPGLEPFIRHIQNRE